MAYNNREQVENMISKANDSIVPVGLSGRTFKVGSLNMIIKMREGKCVYEFIRRYFENKANLKTIERQYRENSVGYNHQTPLAVFTKKQKA
jgi:hypothetical protein